MMYANCSAEQELTETVTSAVLTSACKDIIIALKGTYMTPSGKKMPVKGDVTKLLYATGMSALARRLLYNVQGIT